MIPTDESLSNLLGHINTGLNSASAANLAAQQAKALTPAPSFSLLADIFVQARGDLEMANRAAKEGYQPAFAPLSFRQKKDALTTVGM